MSPHWFSLDRPLLITVCAENPFNYSRAARVGYYGHLFYLTGEIVNWSMLSWAGQTGNKSVSETVKFLYKSVDGTKLQVGTGTGRSGNFTGGTKEKFLIPYGLCQTFEGMPRDFVSITVEGSFSYKIFITDPAATTAFQLPYSLMSGEKILMQASKTGPHTWTGYRIKITEKIVETNDGTCIDYPNDNFKSYSDCIDAELQDKILPTLGCMVPLMSEVNPCSQPIPRLAKHEPLIQWIVNISLNSWGNIEYKSDTCLQPCTLMSIQASVESSETYANNTGTAIDFYFGETIEIEKIVLAYDATSLLVEIGSCLGLWLGLSVVGMYDICFILMGKIRWMVTSKQVKSAACKGMDD